MGNMPLCITQRDQHDFFALFCYSLVETSQKSRVYPRNHGIMAKPTIYLSSTYEDLKEYRRVVFEALRKAGYAVIGM